MNELRKIAMEESLSSFLCPECGAPVSSGINHPDGDHDDWIFEPRCTQCDFVTIGGRTPFWGLQKKTDDVS